MTWVKICGTTNLEDAQLAVEAGADALGFVFYEQSPRNIDPETARQIVHNLPQGVEKVGVYVHQPVEEMYRIADRVGLTAMQVHGVFNDGEILEEIMDANEQSSRLKVILALPASQLASGSLFMSNRLRETVCGVLIDSASPQIPGGTGVPFDWRSQQGTIKTIGSTIPVIVAGGLKSTNVAEAIGLFQPYGVDVVSGVEASPGKKDPERVRAFIAAVRAADKSA
jgi:phosphoribosylanthranilate isomerase